MEILCQLLYISFDSLIFFKLAKIAMYSVARRDCPKKYLKQTVYLIKTQIQNLCIFAKKIDNDFIQHNVYS